ncbi:MAG: DNA polymerase III subunit gamma/tau [Patescibacteria group bacterium]|nr:DNA polymerase III subunit gamma/tau [Patescibacteria group bacterium]
MSLVLYRKYRSQDFDELVGQEHISSILKNAVSQNQLSHAYLFHGSRGLGKTSVARILAKAVNCLQPKPDGNPCCKCDVCVAIQQGKFLDLIEIDAASNRGIDQIRELKEKIEFSPTEGKYKVYIIDEVHMLTTEAFNALLKTLEEPPKHAIFILATTEIHKVPATIMSRCQRFDFRLGTEKEIQGLLKSILKKEGVKIENKALDLIIENARGSYRDALSLLDVVVSGQLEGKDPKKITEEEVRVVLGLADSTMAYFFLEKLVDGDASEALDLIEELAHKGVNLGQFIKFVLSVLRVILIGGLKGDTTFEEYSFAKSLDRSKTLKLINLFVEAERSLKDAVVPTLPLEMLVADAMEYFGGPAEVSKSNPGSSGSNSGDKANGSGENSRFSGESQGKANSNPKPKLKPKKMENSGLSKSSSRSSSKLTMTKAEVCKKWEEILKELRQYNSHLYAFVGRSKVVELKNGVLKLAVGFDFHKDRLEGLKSRGVMSNIFKKLFGKPVKVECIVDNSIRSTVKLASEVVVDAIAVPAQGQKSNVYDSVAEVFGSDLVGI